MSAPITETWQQPPTKPTEPEGNVHNGELEQVPHVIVQEKVIYMTRPRPMWRVLLEALSCTAAGLMALIWIAVLWSTPSISSYNSYDQPSTYSWKDPESVPSAPGTTCANGSVRDATGTCVKEAELEAARAKAEKRFSMQMKDGKADFVQWVEKMALKPALASSHDAVVLSYLCSAKPTPTKDGRFYAANSLGIEDDSSTFFKDGDVKIEVDWNLATSVAQGWCPTVPSWAAPTSGHPVPKPSSPPPPSSAPRGPDVKPGEG